MRSPSRRRFNPPVSLERHACSRKRSNITSRKKSPACSDRCRCLCTETFRGLDGRRVADFLDNQRQSLTREAQGLLQSEQFKVGVRHCCRPPLDPVSIAMPQGRTGCTGVGLPGRSVAFPSTPVRKRTKTAHHGSSHRPPWLRDERAPAPQALIATMHGVPPFCTVRDCSGRCHGPRPIRAVERSRNAAAPLSSAEARRCRNRSGCLQAIRHAGVGR